MVRRNIDEPTDSFIKSGKQPLFSLAQVREHCEPRDCWIIIGDNVYNVTQFLNQHPGGADIILEHAGRDATLAFRGAGHGQDATELLGQFLIGRLIKSDRMNFFTSSAEKISDMKVDSTSNEQNTWHSKKQVVVAE